MGGDHKFYYDFSSEIPLMCWETVCSDDNHVLIKTHINGLSGDYIFLAPCPEFFSIAPRLVSLSVNGQRFNVKKTDAMYVHSDYARYGVEICLNCESNEILAELNISDCESFSTDKPYFSLQKAEASPEPVRVSRQFHAVSKVNYSRNTKACCTDGWHEGAGCRNSPGRFGFTKGDGLLDFAMPALGIVDKKYLCGQPKYRKPYRWSYFLLPEGMPVHSSFEPRDVDITEDDVQINHLSVRWAAKYGETQFSCSYSLASPAVLTERSDNEMLISGLRFAGNYQSVLIPRAEGIEEAPLDNVNIEGMAENWILLFNCTEFPDVPLMLLFERNPDKMSITRNAEGRLLSVKIENCSLMMSCTPFGIERFERGQMDVRKAIRLCRFWSRALLAFPVRCREHFQLDEKLQRVTVRQEYEYRYIKDAWDTEPLELAPLPPPLSICGVAEIFDAEDLNFPTKYGWLYGRIGTWSEYSIPFMPLERKFPLREKNSDIPQKLRQGMKTYQEIVSTFPPEKISYPYAGSILEPFALASTMIFFMNDKDREFIQESLSQRLPIALDSTAQSDYTVIVHSEMMKKQPERDEVIRIYKDPERKHIILRNWFTRVEPFTGATFKICYINLGNFSSGLIKDATPEEIHALKVPLIENDWGAGLTFYYAYLSALATGSFEEIRKNWDLLKDVCAFFELMHDWACMGSGYSDNGITWVEGANYGFFPSYIHMAEAVGDRESRAWGIYNAAKQMCLRLAIMQASQCFFPKLFDVEPWYCAKFFHEESAAYMAFQNVPDLCGENVRIDAAYNFTTEGMYPETYAALRKFGSSAYSEVMSRLERSLLNGFGGAKTNWCTVQEYSGILIDKALDQGCGTEQVLCAVKAGLQKDIVMRNWRGIHIFSRALPENYLVCQIQAWLEMRQHKLWLEHWEEMRIHSAVWDSNKAVIDFVSSGHGSMKLQCGVTELPCKVCLNGIDIPFTEKQAGTIEISVSNSGTLQICFD